LRLFDAGFIGRISGRRAEFQRGNGEAEIRTQIETFHGNFSFSHEEPEQ